jgi:putative ABC transport system permease protein
VGRLTLKNLFARKFRLVLTSIAVILGVAFMAGTFVLTDTLGGVFDSLFVDATKGVDTVVRAKEPFKAQGQNGGAAQTRPPVPQALDQLVRQVPGVAKAQGNVFQYALVQGKDGEAIQHQAPTFGTTWYPKQDSVNQALELVKYRGELGNQPSNPDEVALDVKTAQDGNFKIGDKVTITFLTVEPREFTLTGVFQFGGKEDGLAGATLAAFTPKTAQAVMNRVDQWDSVEVRADDGVSQVELRDAIRKQLPAFRAELSTDGTAVPQLQAITGDQLAKEQSDAIKDNLSFFNTFLLIFALISLFVGAFIIYNTFSITVAQRTREIGLMRALGASGGQVVGSVAFEALMVGLFSSVVGLGVGILLVKPLEGLLSAFGIDLPSGPLDIQMRTIVVSIIVGTLVTFVSAIAPARRAARVPPIAALRDQTLTGTSGRRRYAWGTALTVIGVLVLAYGLFGAEGNSAALAVGISAAVVFVGVSMLSPLLARPAARVISYPAERRKSITGVLAQQNAMRNPRRTASTAAALMIGLALVTLISIFGASFKTTISTAIDDQTRADFILSPKNFAPFSPDAATQVRAKFTEQFGAPGTVVEWRSGTAEVDGTATEVLGVTPNFRQTSEVPLRGTLDQAVLRSGGVVLSDSAADERKCFADEGLSGARVLCHKGAFVPMRFPAVTAVEAVPVAGVFTDAKATGSNSDYLLGFDPATDQWQQRFTDATDLFVFVRKPAGATTKDANAIVKEVAKSVGGIEAENKAEFKDRQIAQFDQILGLMYVLLLFAVLIALIGIVNTLALSIYERTRELGLLRAVGMTRRQMRRMVRNEAVIVAIFGSLLGLVIGLVFGIAIIKALESEGITLSVPIGQLVILVVLAGLAGLLSGVPPARRAARLNVLDAISSE